MTSALELRVESALHFRWAQIALEVHSGSLREKRLQPLGRTSLSFLTRWKPIKDHCALIIFTSVRPIRKRFGSCTVLASLGIPFWARLRLAKVVLPES